MRLIKQILSLIFVVVVAEVIPYGFAKYIADYLGQYFSQTSPLSYFLLGLVHRGVQFLLVVILLKFLFRDKLSNLGFKFNNKSLSLKIIVYVFAIWPLVILGFFFFCMNYLNGFHGYLLIKYHPDIRWMIASISRDLLLLDAFAEEILYRLFVIRVLEKYWHGKISVRKWNASHATLLSVPIFVVAHISLSFLPFKVIGYDPIQLLLTFITGLLFAVSFEKTKNLFVSIVIHGYTNFIITIAAYITVFST